jgi:hypothetical protein
MACPYQVRGGFIASEGFCAQWTSAPVVLCLAVVTWGEVVDVTGNLNTMSSTEQKSSNGKDHHIIDFSSLGCAMR